MGLLQLDVDYVVIVDDERNIMEGELTVGELDERALLRWSSSNHDVEA